MLDEMCDEDSSEKKPNFKRRISKKASNTTKISNGYNRAIATAPAANSISSLQYEPDGVGSLDRPLGKAAEKQMIKIHIFKDND